MAAWVTIDGNEAAASVAHRTNDVIAIYPITPSSTMGELADEWSAARRTNVWGDVPSVTEMQSEAGAIAACHGALQGGSLATTFTASQGLLLMIPSLYKIAGELTPFCMHVAARTVATHALSIFGDHSDVMACRQTGVAMLASASVQEAHDFALIGQAATLASRLPVHPLLRRLPHLARGGQDPPALGRRPAGPAAGRRWWPPIGSAPSRPTTRCCAARPRIPTRSSRRARPRRPFHAACPGIVQRTMDAFAARTGRQYHLFDYVGHPQAERVVIADGLGDRHGRRGGGVAHRAAANGWAC